MIVKPTVPAGTSNVTGAPAVTVPRSTRAELVVPGVPLPSVSSVSSDSSFGSSLKSPFDSARGAEHAQENEEASGRANHHASLDREPRARATSPRSRAKIGSS